MMILGVSCGHDANVCILSEKGVILHYEKERFTRIKHDAGSVDSLAAMALSDVGLTIDDVDLVASSIPVWPERGITGRVLSGQYYKSVFSHSRHVIEILGRQMPAMYVPHHVGHMAYSFFSSPFVEADVIAIDAYGNFTATTVGVGSGASLRTSLDLHPGNFGSLWALISSAVFGDILAAGKVMGLAPFGAPRFVDAMRDRYVSEVQGFAVPCDAWRDRANIPWVPANTSLSWRESVVMDLASSVQALTCDLLVDLASRVAAMTRRPYLCLGGGVALNGIANEAIIAAGAYETVFIPPAVNDGGLSLGFALYALAEETGERPSMIDPRYLSRNYGQDVVERIATSARGRCAVRRANESEIAEIAVTELLEGRTIALWHGRAETGPRALGHRSILSDPRDRGGKDHLNCRVKGREPFRPFGASVLTECLSQMCDMVGPSPFMVRVATIRSEYRARMPAVTHVDGTTRPQSVSAEDAESGPLRQIVEMFARETNTPGVLNTSFNPRGQPIVESPSDALEAFLAMPLDMLILENWIVNKL